MAQNTLILFLFLGSFIVKFGACIIDDCSKNNFESKGNFMQWTKELTTDEYAVAGKFKGLHCCAKGYRSVEWIKDDQQYPWRSSVSGLILYPESANQTIYTQRVTAEDAGNYTCLLRNDTHLLKHSISLKVYEKSPDTPLITYLSDSKEVSVGHSVRLFCEAFVGVVDLEDAFSESIWRKNGENETSLDEQAPRVRQEKVSREDGQTFGTYLIIDEVTEDDFGWYTCKIINPGRPKTYEVYLREKVHVDYLNPNPFPWKKMIVWSSFITVIMITLLFINMKFGLSLRVKFKDYFGEIEDGDGKMSDALVVYSSSDSQFVYQILLPGLETEYRCATRELPTTLGTWYGNLSDLASKSRRLIAVLSPSSLNHQWDTKTMYQAVKQLGSMNAQLTCVTFEDMPKDETEQKNSDGETLVSALKTCHVLRWNREQEHQFWLGLKLRLPPIRRHQIQQTSELVSVSLATSKTNTRLSTDSQDSLDDLV